jgi:acyl carrier protein
MTPPPPDRIASEVMEAIKTASRRPVEPVLESELVADLGFDSLQVLDLVAELENRFDIAIPLEAVPAARTVCQVVDQVSRLVAARNGAHDPLADAR